MPSKKKKYNARFPAGRIKKIMQSDEEIGKVAQAVPVIISRTVELFVESLLKKTLRITNSRNAKTLSTSHLKQCIMAEQRFDFLRELVKNVPDISVAEEAANYNEEDGQSSPEDAYPDSDTPYDLSMASTSGGRINMHLVSATKNNGGQLNCYYNKQQNGTSHDATEIDLRQRIRQNVGHNTRSVIMHTASVTQSCVSASASTGAADDLGTVSSAHRGTAGNYIQPLKLMRSESSPANTAQHLWHVAPNAVLQQQQGHKRIRHQAQSVPCSSSKNNGNCQSSSPPKRHKAEHTAQQQLQSQTAIPAPVFSYDLCNKPIVKIDYSNLPLTPAVTGTSEQLQTTTAASSSILPLSAPVTNASFNFDPATPIINIDLSNIVTNSVDINMSTGNKVSTPAIATISIGALPADLISAGATSFSALKVPPHTSTTPPSNQSTDSKSDSNVTTMENTSSSVASSSSCSSSSSSLASTSANSYQGGNKTNLKATTELIASKTNTTFSATCKNSNSFLELDEDYDNI
ncbi:uncharacterized protein NC2alpha [Eurosta solidaginis]|uniref:uncharacterized protein NC2alpha n=1 Tax=Eurosta solidaginis TaxID=178769 RepID=UPI00353126C9